MKKTVIGAFLCAAMILPSTTTCQVTTPAVRANFGADADAAANLFNGMAIDGPDDWFNDLPGIGEAIIDTSGAAALLLQYAADPASRKQSFSRLMKQQPFTIVNNCILLDAVFHRDFHGDDSTVFAQGGNKNGMNPADWTCPVSQSVPDKNEILDVFTHVRREGPSINDSLWLFGAISIENTNGNRYFDFELCQTELYYDMTVRRFMNVGPDAGHTSWKFDSAGNVILPGDIIFSAEFSSSAMTNLEARIWVAKADLSITPAAFVWGGEFDGATNNAAYGYASILPRTAGDFYTGLQSATPVWAGSFGLIRKDNSFVTNYEPKQFMEFSVNLSKLGLDPAAYSVNICNSPFRRVLVKTRASTSFSSELKDFVAPMRMFQYPPVDAYTPLIYYCDTMPGATIRVANPNQYSIYTWTTTDGQITGSHTGPEITIHGPGIYYVQQSFHSQCNNESMDSVLILYDTACSLLPITITEFNASPAGNRTEINWKVLSDQVVSGYSVEFSTDNRNFLSAASIPSRNYHSPGQYSYTHPWNRGSGRVYYRLRITALSGQVSYSRVVPVNFYDEVGGFTVYPNPSKGRVFLSLNAGKEEKAVVQVFDSRGRKVGNRNLSVSAGENTIRLDEMSGLQPGAYFIRLQMPGSMKTRSIIIQ